MCQRSKFKFLVTTLFLYIYLFFFNTLFFRFKFLLKRNLRFKGCLSVDYSALAVYHKQSSLEGFLIKVARTVSSINIYNIFSHCCLYKREALKIKKSLTNEYFVRPNSSVVELWLNVPGVPGSIPCCCLIFIRFFFIFNTFSTRRSSDL